MRRFVSHGSGQIERALFRSLGENVIFEHGVLAFHPEKISIGRNVYIGHYSILKGYHQNELIIEDDVWIGPQCFLHSAGGLRIGSRVGIGPGVRIITSWHREEGRDKPILESELEFAPISIGSDSDIGMSTVILPGVKIGKGVQVGAGAVVTKDIADYAVAAGVPANVIRMRPEIAYK